MNADPESLIRRGKRRNSANWCRRRLGVEHVFVINDSSLWGLSWWKTYICLNCGRKKFQAVKV
jgi:hypothetical protein